MPADKETVYKILLETPFKQLSTAIKSFINFVKLIFTQKSLIISLAKREVANQYIGSFLGFIWTFIHPAVLIFVFWVVFSVGFRVQPTNDVPFVVWLTAGLSAWFIFAEIVGGSASSVVANAHLVKKTLFHSQTLPVVKIASCLIKHSIFLSVLFCLIVILNLPFSLYYLQFIYYLFCMIVLSLGIGWTVAALNVFIRDVGQVVNVVLQVGMWATPILWDINIMPSNIQMILKLNPMFYIVQGYRESFIYFSPFWNHPLLTLYFWIVAITMFVLGAYIFKKLKPHFADVL